MREMAKLPKLKKGDKVAVLSPSFAGPGKWPHVYELGLRRIRETFELEPIEFPTTKRLGASGEDRAKDLIAAFENPDIKAVITSIGGNDQVTYVRDLPEESFKRNPKPFFGYSDNTHLANFLWLNGIPSYYGGSVLTQFARQKQMDEYTVTYLKKALFEKGEFELTTSDDYNDIALDWADPALLEQSRVYEPSDGWYWDGGADAEGITWGGCLESIDEMLRHDVPIPSLDDFENVILITETSEEIPPEDYVFRVYRALGQRGILARIRGVFVGRPQAWEFQKQKSAEEKSEYRAQQREVVRKVVRMYNPRVPIIQNMNFGHTDPQIALPYGRLARIDLGRRRISIDF